MAIEQVMGRLAAAMRPIVGEQQVSTGDLAAWGGDASQEFALPGLVVAPGSVAEVAAVVRLATRAGVAVTTRGAGSGLAGGAVPQPGGLVLSMARLSRIVELDAAAMTATVEAGVVTGDLQAMVEAQNLFYPPDPASLSWCTIGGNVACNAGGPRAFKYGMTRNYVLGLTVVLADGQIVRLGSKTHKQSSGYNLSQLFVGSEGTLAVICEATLRLIPRPAARATLTALFPTLLAASEAVTAVLHSGCQPCAVELMDQATIRAVESVVHLGLPLEAGALLLVEVDGAFSDALAAELVGIQHICESFGASALAVATGDEERARLWLARRNVYHGMVAAAPNFYLEDVVVPRSVIPQLVGRVAAIAVETGVQIAVAGHAGDGNLHPCILFDGSDLAQAAAAKRAESAIVEAALALGGMVSGEHGVGSRKQPYLAAGVGDPAYALMRAVKRTLDPHNLLNPGKVVTFEQ